MNNKKITAVLTLSLLLGSGMAGAEWGDVYSCTTNFGERTLNNGSKRKIKLYNYQFKLDKTKKGMVFDGGHVQEVDPHFSSSGDWWFYKVGLYTYVFDDGRFVSSSIKPFGLEGYGVNVYTGTCRKL